MKTPERQKALLAELQRRGIDVSSYLDTNKADATNFNEMPPYPQQKPPILSVRHPSPFELRGSVNKIFLDELTERGYFNQLNKTKSYKNKPDVSSVDIGKPSTTEHLKHGRQYSIQERSPSVKEFYRDMTTPLSADLTKGGRWFNDDWKEYVRRSAINLFKNMGSFPVDMARAIDKDPTQFMIDFATFIPKELNELYKVVGANWEINPDFDFSKITEVLIPDSYRSATSGGRNYGRMLEERPTKDRPIRETNELIQRIPPEKIAEARKNLVENPLGAVVLLLPFFKRAIRKTSGGLGTTINKVCDKIQDNFACYGGDLKNPLGKAIVGEVRKRHAEIEKANYNSVEYRRKMEKGLKASDKEDLIFAIEKTENPWRLDTKKTQPYERLSTKAKSRLMELRQRFNDVRDRVNKSGASDDLAFIENYVTHFWKIKRKTPEFDQAVAYFRENNPFAKKRAFTTMQEGIVEGFKPKYNNIFDILEQYERINTRVVQNNTLVRTIKDLKIGDIIEDTADKTLPLRDKLIKLPDQPMPDNYLKINSGALHRALQGKKKSVGLGRDFTKSKTKGTEVWVHPEIYKPLKTIFDEPFTGNFLHRVETLNAVLKKLRLTASFFHHIALTESALYSGILPWSCIKGVKLLKDKRIRNDMLNSELQIGAISDVQRGRVRNFLKDMEVATRNIKGAHQGAKLFRKGNDLWDGALWDYYHPGLKAFTWYTSLGKVLKKHKSLTPSQMKEVKRAVARFTNNAFGGQNWNALLKSAKWRQLMHLAFLAPDWTISNIKIATSAFKTKRGGLGAGVEGSLARKYWLRALPSFYFYSNLANKALSGHFMWENEKDHKWDIDTGEKDDKGRRIYTIASKQVREPIRWLTATAHEAAVKSAPAIQLLCEGATGRSVTGWPTELQRRKERGEDVNIFEEIFLRGEAIGRHALPFSMGENNIGFSFPMRRGANPKREKGKYVRKILDLKNKGKINEACDLLLYWNIQFPQRMIEDKDVNEEARERKNRRDSNKALKEIEEDMNKGIKQ